MNMNEAGSWKAILFELHYGTIWTLLDEIWHAIDWFLPELHYRFCQWSHLKDDEWFKSL